MFMMYHCILILRRIQEPQDQGLACQQVQPRTYDPSNELLGEPARALLTRLRATALLLLQEAWLLSQPS